MLIKLSVCAYWKEGIDNYISKEKLLNNSKPNAERKPLTKEKAIQMWVF